MKFELEAMVQRGHDFAIVDEVDSILIDEARTPLIISGPSEETTDKYYKCNRVIPKLVRGKEETDKTGTRRRPATTWSTRSPARRSLTEEGVAQAEKLLGVDNLYDIDEHGPAPRRSTRRCARTTSTRATSTTWSRTARSSSSTSSPAA